MNEKKEENVFVIRYTTQYFWVGERNVAASVGYWKFWVDYYIISPVFQNLEINHKPVSGFTHSSPKTTSKRGLYFIHLLCWSKKGSDLGAKCQPANRPEVVRLVIGHVEIPWLIGQCFISKGDCQMWFRDCMATVKPFTHLFCASSFSYAIIMWEVLSRRIPFEGRVRWVIEKWTSEVHDRLC